MSATPKISESAIREWVGEKSFERGRRYFQAGAIFAARRQGATLKALCKGSRPEPYRVEVILGSKSIQEARCSCPVGEYGRCKHVAALLLTWLHNSDEFTEVEELEVALERRTKAELIALIKQMLLRRPELEALLLTPLPAGQKRCMPVEPQAYRKQAATILRYAARDYEWGAASRAAGELNAIVAIGDGFADQQDWASATAVYQGVSAAVLEHFGSFHDEEGDLGAVVQDCVAGLGRCLAGMGQDPAAREGILRALFETYRWDLDFGGVGVSDAVPDMLLVQTTVAERRQIAAWVRAALPPSQDQSSHAHWQRESYGGFLLQLEREVLNDEAFLRICRETGRAEDLIDKLLALGRLDEATAEARKVGDYELLQLAELFVRRGQGPLAESLVAERSTEDPRVLEWLEARYAARGDWAAALELTLRAFRMQPSLGPYRQMREFAKQLKQWSELRPKLLAGLANRREWGLLTDIYLDEGEIDEAVEIIRQAPSGTLWGSGRLEAVARAAEKPRPEAAIELYDQLAGRLIALRGRGNYQEACRYLKKMKELHERIKKKRSWARYISQLRERHRALRALLEELTAAGLEVGET